MLYDTIASTIKEQRDENPEVADVLDELAEKMAGSLSRADQSLDRARFLSLSGVPEKEPKKSKGKKRN